MRKLRAFTLVEIMVAVCILLILLMALAFLLGPSVRAKGIETRMRNDMRQLAVAVRLYLDENDDHYPMGWESLRNPPPICFPNWPLKSAYSSASSRTPYGNGCYNLEFGFSQEVMERRGSGRFKYPYDQTKNALISEHFYAREQDRTSLLEFFSGPGNVIGSRKVKMPLVMAVRHDGSAYWKPEVEAWEQERIGCIGLLLQHGSPLGDQEEANENTSVGSAGSVNNYSHNVRWSARRIGMGVWRRLHDPIPRLLGPVQPPDQLSGSDR